MQLMVAGQIGIDLTVVQKLVELEKKHIEDYVITQHLVMEAQLVKENLPRMLNVQQIHVQVINDSFIFIFNICKKRN